MKYRGGVALLILGTLGVAILFTSIASASTQLNLGGTIHASIGTVGEIDTYTFSTTKNDRILIRVVSTTGGFVPVVKLRAPNGTEINSGNWGTDVFIEDVMPDTGTYSVQVYSYYGDWTGNYSLYISSLTSPESPTPIAFEQTAHASIEPQGEIDTFTFSTTEKDKILIRVVSTSGFIPVVKLRAPNGTEINSGNWGTDVFIEGVMPDTGTYSIKVYSFYGDATGNYSIYASSLLAPQSTIIPGAASPAPTSTTAQNATAYIPEIPSPVVPAATAGVMTIIFGVMSAVFKESVLNVFSRYWEKIDKILKKFLKIGSKYSWDELEKKYLGGEDVTIDDSGYLRAIIVGGAILFLAFLMEFMLHPRELVYTVSLPFFIAALAFFMVLAEIGHDWVLKSTVQSMGGKKYMELSFLGSIVTILTGIFGFVVTAVLSSGILHRSENHQQKAIITASGSIFNLVIGMFLLLMSFIFHIEWIAIAGAMPNLAYAAFSLIPLYPFEGKEVMKGSIMLWGLLFFTSSFLYIYITVM